MTWVVEKRIHSFFYLVLLLSADSESSDQVISLLPLSARTVPGGMKPRVIPDNQDPSCLSARLDSVEEEENMQNVCMELVPLNNKKFVDEDRGLATEDEQRVALPNGEEGGMQNQIELGFQVKIKERVVIGVVDLETGVQHVQCQEKKTTKTCDCDLCTKACILLTIAFVLLLVAIVSGIVIWKFVFDKSPEPIANPFVSQTEKPVTVLTTLNPDLSIKCPSPQKTVYLTQERQEVTLSGVTYANGKPIPELHFKPDVDGTTTVYQAPAKLIITRNSTGKSIPIEATLKYMDQPDRTAKCSYNLRVEGIILCILFSLLTLLMPVSLLYIFSFRLSARVNFMISPDRQFKL